MQGTAEDQGQTQNEYIGSARVYNETFDNTMHVGFKYGESGDLESNRTNTHNSAILGEDDDQNAEGESVTLNGWYNVNINQKTDSNKNSWDKYISRTAIYCNDRATSSYNNSSSTNSMYYASRERLELNKRPSYACGVEVENNEYKGLYGTASEADKFSGTNEEALLTNPIGLITGDELAFAGGVYGTNAPSTYYYLNASGQSATGGLWWWTMQPYGTYKISDGGARMTTSGGWTNPGRAASGGVGVSHVTRPVISLKSCLEFSQAKGTADDPYKVVAISEKCALADN